MWQGQRDSNPQPTVLETVALSIALCPYLFDGSHHPCDLYIITNLFGNCKGGFQIFLKKIVCLSNICYTVLDEIMECIFWRFPSKRSHWEAVIISIIISFELYSEIFKREETMRGIKAFAILAMTAFYFPIVSWGKGTNLFVLDA